MSNNPREGTMNAQALRVIESVASDLPPLSLQLPDATTFEEWVSIGRKLCAGQQALNWHIGDWWAFGGEPDPRTGKPRYGERAKAAAEGIFGLSFKSLMNYGSVSRAFEASNRLEVLSFTHHMVAAPLANTDPSAARVLLQRAAHEQMSVGEVRREVQALKVANDPGLEAEQRPQPVSPPRQYSPSHRELVESYTHFVEAMESLQEYRCLNRRENDFLAVALEYLDRGNDSRRPCPEDFDIIFQEKGRLECETWYRASRLTVNRWLLERGKRRLLDARAAFVRHMRDQEHAKPAPVIDAAPDDPLHRIAAQAASFLRVSRYGGWTITQNPVGGWRVGTVQKSSDELVAMAERQGFDSVAASLQPREAE